MHLRIARFPTAIAAISALLLAGGIGSGIAGEPGAGPASLAVTISGARSGRGVIRLAICPQGAGFPDCGARAARTATLPVTRDGAHAAFADLPPGRYAVSVYHDANGNGRLDTVAGIPREGFGFSRNPPLRPRAPRFAEAEILIPATASTAITLRYLF